MSFGTEDRGQAPARLLSQNQLDTVNFPCCLHVPMSPPGGDVRGCTRDADQALKEMRGLEPWAKMG